MEQFEKQVQRTIEEHHMLKPGSRVIAALSGGADSVCLLDLLCRFKDRYGIQIRAVHVHHGLRAGEADRDAEFAERFCKSLSVPCHIIKVDVRGLAAAQGMSEEEAARQLRYEALEKAAAAWDEESGETDSPPARIAVAHHRGDQAETILHNMLRGSGLGGLKGMPYTRDRIIRPLLETDRKEILKWLKDHERTYVLDSTNTSGHYTRNRIRGHVLPVMEAEVNQGAAGNLLRLGAVAAMADSYLEEQAASWIEQNGIREEGTVSVPAEALKREAPVIRTYVIMHILKELAGSAKDLGWIHVEQAAGLLDRGVGKQADLPYGLLARRSYDSLILCRKEEKKEKTWEPPVLEVKCQIVSYEKGEEFPKNMYTKWFDCDKIKGTPVVRTRQQGDYIMLSDGSQKTVKRFMIDEKIPREIRDRIPLLADGSHVMWIIGYRISAYYKINSQTKRVLKAEAGHTVK